jgi:hypothetical protein
MYPFAFITIGALFHTHLATGYRIVMNTPHKRTEDVLLYTNGYGALWEPHQMAQSKFWPLRCSLQLHGSEEREKTTCGGGAMCLRAGS